VALLTFAVACADVADPVAPDDSSQFAPAAKSDPNTKNNLSPGPGQPVVNGNLNPLAIYPLDPDRTVFDPFKQNLAQTFMATTTATLRYVELPLACAVDVLARIQILAGGPDGTLLFDRNYDVLKSFQDGTFTSFQIYGGVSLTAGTTYAIVMSSFPRASATAQTCSIVPGPVGDSYADGVGYANNPGFTPYWIPIVVQIVPGTVVTVGDLPFRTLVR
jgi:hypothetical protein